MQLAEFVKQHHDQNGNPHDSVGFVLQHPLVLGTEIGDRVYAAAKGAAQPDSIVFAVPLLDLPCVQVNGTTIGGSMGWGDLKHQWGGEPMEDQEVVATLAYTTWHGELLLYSIRGVQFDF
jgi:hypothetical protein